MVLGFFPIFATKKKLEFRISLKVKLYPSREENVKLLTG